MLNKNSQDEEGYDDFLQEAIREYRRKVFLKKLLAFIVIVSLAIGGIFHFSSIENESQYQVEAAQNNQ